MVRNGLELEFESPPTMLHFPSNTRMGEEQLSIGRDEVRSLIQKGAAVRVSRIQFVSQMFIIKKQSGGFRPIINLKSLNQFVVYRHFKMENLASLRHLIMKGDWMVKLDLKDAYLTVPVHKDFHDFLQFVWEGEVFQFTCLCFGLASAPWAFTKLLRPVVAFLRSLGFRVIIYLADIILLNQCKIVIVEQLDFIKRLLQILGFVINSEKSEESPAQLMEFLGMMVDSVLMRFRLP